MKLLLLCPVSVVFVAAAFLSSPLCAAIPDGIPYQGRVAVDGVNFTGTGQFKFAIYQHTNGGFMPASATATLTGSFVTSVALSSGGAGYSPAVTVGFSGGGGSGAAATASVSGGVITSITVTVTGSGYTSAPSVVLTDPNAPSQLWNNAAGATTGTLAEPASAVSRPVTNGLYVAGLGDTALTNMAALPASLAPVVGKRAFVRVWFNDNSHGFQAITPDTELRSVPFAREAANAANLGGVALANFARTDAANTFTNVNGVTVTGTGPSGTTPATGATVPLTGAGTRMEFIPGYGAFRAGTVSGAQWNAVNIGLYSTAMGYNPTALGTCSTALGDSTTASGGCSSALGYTTTASGFASTAWGYNTTASGSHSTALGTNTTASEYTSTAMGFYTTASGFSSTAMGDTTTASGYASTAMGRNTTASGQSSTASGEYSTAMGYNTNASGFSSTALGDSTTAESGWETVIGRYDTNYSAAFINGWNDADRLFVIGNGTAEGSRSDALIVFKNGNARLQGTLSQGSDRNRKTDIVAADTAAVLTKVAALPLATWKYRDETVTHLGPMAQDFFAAFQLGGDEKSIASVDADGVALAAIQELKKQLDAVKAQNATLAQQNAAKDERIAALEREQAATNARLVALEAKLASRP